MREFDPTKSSIGHDETQSTRVALSKIITVILTILFVPSFYNFSKGVVPKYMEELSLTGWESVGNIVWFCLITVFLYLFIQYLVLSILRYLQRKISLKF